MTLCDRLIGGVVQGIADAIETVASFWQTPREVEWAKAAADGLAEREAEEEVSEPWSASQLLDEQLPDDLQRHPYRYTVPDGPPIDMRDIRVGDKYCLLCGENITTVSFHACPMRTKTSAPTPGAESGPAEGEPPEPSAVVGTVCIVCFRPSGNCDCVERLFGPFPAHSAAVESPASVPAAECSAPEFDWVTAAIPVIAGVLGDHVPAPERDTERVHCYHPGDLWTVCGEFADWEDWRNHVAPHVAISIRLQTPRSATSYDFPSGDRPRPLADFPKHQTPRM